MEKALPAAKTWAYVEPYLYKNADSGRYYSRLGRQGFRALKTDRISIARLRLADKLRDHKTQIAFVDTAKTGDVTMAEVIESFRVKTKEAFELGQISQSTASDRKISLLRLERTWPKLGELKPRHLSQADITVWANRASRTAATPPPGAKIPKGSYSPRAVQKAGGVLRMVLAHAVELNAIAVAPLVKVAVGRETRAKAKELPSRSILQSLFDELQFPRNQEIRRAVLAMDLSVEGKTQAQVADEMGISLATFKRHKTGTTVGNGKDTADFARILVYTGMRVDEARNLTWGHIDLEKGRIAVPGTKTPTSKRTIPMIAECRSFLESLPRQSPEHKVSQVSGINRALAAASKRLGIPKLTHHSMRHLFATICIESGVDIPTVSRWLGHADGGALAMRTYGHLRDEHSQAAAARVRVFG